MDFHVPGANGAVLTRFWYGGYKPAYNPLTHFVVAAKAPSGVVLVEHEGGTFWSLPGGPIAGSNMIRELAAAKFHEQTGMEAQKCELLGYFRILLPAEIEYGALMVCNCGQVDAKKAASHEIELHAWDCKDEIAGIEPISAALAAFAATSKLWQSL
jgi:hypothetical protein